jgi:hypothetical protein
LWSAAANVAIAMMVREVITPNELVQAHAIVLLSEAIEFMGQILLGYWDV